MRAVAALLVSLLFLPGCITNETDPTDREATDDQIIVDADRPKESFGDIITGPAVGPDLDATTAAAPRLVEGEWWRIRYEAYLNDQLVEVVRVVANATGEGYIIGMPHEGWLKEAIAFHSPAFGDVALDLSYDTHNQVFQTVRFPLIQGDTWETHFAATTYVATVESVDDYTATITFRTPEPEDTPENTLMGTLGLVGSNDMTLTYDARQHEIVRMESALGLWEVIEHGYGYEGWVTVPRGQHTAIDYGVMGPVSNAHTPMAEERLVEGGFNRLTMMHFIGTLNDAPAQVTVRDVDPEDNEMLTEFQGSGMMIRFYESNAPDGTWSTENVIGGTAFAYHMGIAYHQFDIRLPDQVRRTDHSHAVVR